MSKKPDPLSHSSAMLLRGCEQKYVYYKVKDLPKDSDVEDSNAFSIGKAVHYIMEQTRHTKPEDIDSLLNFCQEDQDIRLDPEHRWLVAAMSLKMARLNKRMDFDVLEVEFDIGDGESVIGYVDAIMQDKETGKWWIVDLKTTRTLYLATVPQLCQDPQLNLYAAHVNQIAERFDLDPDNFGGCRWRVVTKPGLKRKASENDVEYTKRLLKACKSYDIAIPIEQMNPSETLERHLDMWGRAKKLCHPRAKPKKNFGNCMAYFKPCDWWSNCHGGLYSETKLEVTEES